MHLAWSNYLKDSYLPYLPAHSVIAQLICVICPAQIKTLLEGKLYSPNLPYLKENSLGAMLDLGLSLIVGILSE